MEEYPDQHGECAAEIERWCVTGAATYVRADGPFVAYDDHAAEIHRLQGECGHLQADIGELRVENARLQKAIARIRDHFVNLEVGERELLEGFAHEPATARQMAEAKIDARFGFVTEDFTESKL